MWRIISLKAAILKGGLAIGESNCLVFLVITDDFREGVIGKNQKGWEYGPRFFFYKEHGSLDFDLVKGVVPLVNDSVRPSTLYLEDGYFYDPAERAIFGSKKPYNLKPTMVLMKQF